MDGGAEVSGTVTSPVDKTGKPLSAWIDLNPVDSNETIQAKVHSDNQFLTHVSPGAYNLKLRANNGWIAASVELEERNILDEGLTISGPRKIHLKVALAREAAELKGSIVDADGKAVSGATVVVMPEPGLRANPARFRNVETDQNGHFAMSSAMLGNYAVIAAMDLEDGIWFDPDFQRAAEAKAEAVVLRSNGKATVKLMAVTVP